MDMEGMRRTLGAMEHPFDTMVRQHGPNIGYGRMMQLVSQVWHEKDPIGAFTVGPCYKQVEVYGDYFEVVDERDRLREVLQRFKQVIEQRRSYVRERYHDAKRTHAKPGRPNTGDIYGEALRGGMLSELSTISAVLKMIEDGNGDVSTWWIGPQAIGTLLSGAEAEHDPT